MGAGYGQDCGLLGEKSPLVIRMPLWRNRLKSNPHAKNPSRFPENPRTGVFLRSASPCGGAWRCRGSAGHGRGPPGVWKPAPLSRGSGRARSGRRAPSAVPEPPPATASACVPQHAAVGSKGLAFRVRRAAGIRRPAEPAGFQEPANNGAALRRFAGLPGSFFGLSGGRTGGSRAGSAPVRSPPTPRTCWPRAPGGLWKTPRRSRGNRNRMRGNGNRGPGFQKRPVRGRRPGRLSWAQPRRLGVPRDSGDLVAPSKGIVAGPSGRCPVELDVQEGIADQGGGELDALPGVGRCQTEASSSSWPLFCSPATCSTRARRLRQALRVWSGSEVSMRGSSIMGAVSPWQVGVSGGGLRLPARVTGRQRPFAATEAAAARLGCRSGCQLWK